MKHVTILALEGEASLSNIEGTHKILNSVNGFLRNAGKSPLFEVQIAGLSKRTKTTSGLFTVNPNFSIDEEVQTDLIVIPAVHGDIKEVLNLNKRFFPWIVKHHQRGTEIASLCIGAFVLASTGILKGRECSTHWSYAAQFREMFPDVKLVPEKIITDENGIYSSGGAYSSLNLILYLIEKIAGRDMAVQAAKVFEIEMERNSQSPFIIFKGQKEHDDEVVKRVQDFIENNYHSRITIEQLGDMFAISRRHLERRFKKATCNTVIEYVQRVRIEAAKLNLESLRDNVNEVMYKTGYSDPKAFRTIFKKITGLSPIEYRQKYNRNASAA